MLGAVWLLLYFPCRILGGAIAPHGGVLFHRLVHLPLVSLIAVVARQFRSVELVDADSLLEDERPLLAEWP